VTLPIVLSHHALEMIATRRLRDEWVFLAVGNPDRSAPDPLRPGIMLAWRRVPEFGDRALRVAYRTNSDHILVVTAFFDRGARS